MQPEPSETTTEEPKKVHRLSIRASGIPSSKFYGLDKGVLKPLTQDIGEFRFTIEFDVESAEGIPEKKIEQVVMETLRQLGARIEQGDAE
jgi:hypothetical protein